MEETASSDPVREFHGKAPFGTIVICFALLFSLGLFLVFSSISVFLGCLLIGLTVFGLSCMRYRSIIFRLSGTELIVFWKGREWRYPRDRLVVSMVVQEISNVRFVSIECSDGERTDRFPGNWLREGTLKELLLLTAGKEGESAEEEGGSREDAPVSPETERMPAESGEEYALYPERRVSPDWWKEAVPRSLRLSRNGLSADGVYMPFETLSVTLETLASGGRRLVLHGREAAFSIPLADPDDMDDAVFPRQEEFLDAFDALSGGRQMPYEAKFEIG